MEAEKRLYDSLSTWDLKIFRTLLLEEPSILTRVSFTSPNKTPLHIATMQGKLDFVNEILNHNTHLAEQLDSEQSSALHIASAKGYLDIVEVLLPLVTTDVCLLRPDSCFLRDCHGRNPLHLAAVKGHVPVLKHLVQVAPAAAWEKVDQGTALFHLCVKHNQLEALRALMTDLKEMINDTDDDGDTLLHLAVRDNRNEIIKYLVEDTKIDVKANNSKGQTASDILKQRSFSKQQIRDLLSSGNSNIFGTTRPEKWLIKKRDAIMVVAILIATMAFQAGVTPPGGVWQDTQKDVHKAGEAVMSHIHPRAYRSFLKSNTIAFVSSLSTILLLISGLPFKRKLFMWFLMVIMWLTITSIAATYAISIVVVTPKKDTKSLAHVLEIGIAAWCGVMAILLLGNTIRLIDRWLKNRGITLWRPKRFTNLLQEPV